jgi:hypothetical protein
MTEISSDRRVSSPVPDGARDARRPDIPVEEELTE